MHKSNSGIHPVYEGLPIFLKSGPGACWIWENMIWIIKITNFDAVLKNCTNILNGLKTI